MKVPRVLFTLTKQLDDASIDYRIGGGQAAVYYGFKEDAADWDIAIETVTPELKEILKQLEFVEIPDSEGLSWEGPILIDFIIADGKKYPTLEELGVTYADKLKFVARSMMGYINWKEGESAYQHLKEYRNKIEDADLPKAVDDVFSLEKFERMSKNQNNHKSIGNSGSLMRKLFMEKSPMIKVLASLTRLAQSLDLANFPLQATQADRLVGESLETSKDIMLPEKTESSVQPDQYKSSADEARKQRIIDHVLYEVTDVAPATIRYYRGIETIIKQFSDLLDSADSLEKGSQKYIEIVRYVSNKFNSIYDPYNTAHVPTKIRFIQELLKLEDLVKSNVDKIATPEHGFETIVGNFISRLKESGALQEINKLKKLVE